MSSYTLGQKVEAATRLLAGMRLPEVKRALEPHGFTLAVVDDGLERLRAVILARHDASGVTLAEKNVSSLSTLKEFCGLWIPIARYVLKNTYPEAGDELFRGLPRVDGPEVVVVLNAFLARLDAMAKNDPSFGPDGAAALSALAVRGLTTSVRLAARQSVESFAEPPPSVAPQRRAREREEAALERLWAWHQEWSVIARKAVKHRNRRLALGLVYSRPPIEAALGSSPATSARVSS